MCYFHYRSNITRVIHTLAIVVILHVSYRTMYECLFWWYQGVLTVWMSWSNHVHTSHTHSQRFKHCRTSIVMFVVKCTLSVALVIQLSHRGKCIVHVSWMICVDCVVKYSKCVIIVEFLSSVTHLAISRKASRPSNLASPNLPELRIAQFQSSSCDLPPWHCAIRNSCLPGLLHCKFFVLKTQPWAQNCAIPSPSLASTAHFAISSLKLIPWAPDLHNYVVPQPPLPTKTAQCVNLVPIPSACLIGFQNYVVFSLGLAWTTHYTVSKLKPQPWALELCNHLGYSLSRTMQ